MKDVIMGIITLLATGLVCLELGALAQGTANILLLIISVIVAVISITYWERRRL